MQIEQIQIKNFRVFKDVKMRNIPEDIVGQGLTLIASSQRLQPVSRLGE